MFLRYTLEDGAVEPIRQHICDAGLDLYASPREGLVTLKAGETRRIGTGLRIAIPPGYYGQIVGRSGLALKGIAVLGGCIDSEYRGEIGVILHNHGPSDWVATPGKPIAQLVVMRCEFPTLVRSESLDSTARGEGGFGSTDSSLAG